MVVPVLLSPPSVAPLATGRNTHDFKQAHLENRLAEMGPSPTTPMTAPRQRSPNPDHVARRDPQLPVAAESGQRRTAIRHARAENSSRRRSSRVPTITIASDFDGPGHGWKPRYRKQFFGQVFAFASSPGSVTMCPKEAPQEFTQRRLSMPIVYDGQWNWRWAAQPQRQAGERRTF